MHLSDRKRGTMPVRKEGMCSFPAKVGSMCELQTVPYKTQERNCLSVIALMKFNYDYYRCRESSGASGAVL